MFENVYKNKTVLTTGHTGFKGSWLCLWLKELGANVVGYALEPYTKRDNFIVTGLKYKITHIIGDIRDFHKLSCVFEKYQPEFVFHFAAQPIVRESYANPKETYDINIGGTVNVLECCRLTDSVKIIINVTSDKCYENKECIWGYRENDSMGGYDPYSSSKACSELITTAYRNSFFNPNDFEKHKKSLSSVRAGNVIGGGDWAKDRIIPDCIRALENDESIKIRNSQSIRPWQYVLEPLGGYLLLGTRMAENPRKYSSAWNFGPESSSILTVQEIVELVIDNWGSGSWVKLDENKKLYEAEFLALDIRKARFELGWRPCLNIGDAVRHTINWYKVCQKQNSISNFCKKQIKDYMEKMQIK